MTSVKHLFGQELVGRVIFQESTASYTGQFELLLSGWVSFPAEDAEDVTILVPPNAIYQIEVHLAPRKDATS